MEEDDGTARIREREQSPTYKPKRPDSPDRGTFSQHRLSSLFEGLEGWLRPTPPDSPTRAGIKFTTERKNVSEPKLLSHNTGNGTLSANGIPEEDGEGDIDTVAYERMLVRLLSYPF